jgi:hypothetical protein
MAAGVAILGIASSAAAYVPAGLVWNAPAACPGRDAVLQRLRQTGDAQAAPSPIDARVTISQGDDDRWRAQIQLVAGHAWTDRSIDPAPSCEAVVDAIVVVLSVAAASNPAAPERPPAPPAPSPSVPQRAADPRDEFGHRGQLVITGDAQASFETGANVPEPLVLLAPAADLFVMDGLSVGALLLCQHAFEEYPANLGALTVQGTPGVVQSGFIDAQSDGLGAGMRLGYDIRLGGLWSFWPTASVVFEHTWFKSGSVVTTENNSVLFDAFAPVLVHPAPHFFLGFGPAMEVLGDPGTDIPGVMEYGLRLTVGGWVDALGRKSS